MPLGELPIALSYLDTRNPFENLELDRFIPLTLSDHLPIHVHPEVTLQVEVLFIAGK